MSDNHPVYRKEFIFDIDTKKGNILWGDYHKVYPIIGSYLKKNGFKHIEGSAYRSIYPLKRERFLRMFRKLLKQYPNLAPCIKSAHLSEVMDEYSLIDYIKNFSRRKY